MRHNPFVLPTHSLDKVVEESIAFLKEHELEEGYFVGFSGGKDSIVTLELCRMAGVKHQAYYSCTGIDAPEVVQFIKKNYSDVIFLYPKMTFWKGIRKKSPPLRMMRWCCDVLKKDPSKHIQLKYRVMGIRAEESARRAARGRISKYKKNTVIKPIFYWREWHVWDFIEQYKLPYPSLYDEGFDRIGCVICPFLSAKAHEAHKNRWPKTYRVFEKVVKEWWNTRRLINETQKEQNAQEYLERYYNGFK